MKICLATLALLAAFNARASIIDLVWRSDLSFSHDAKLEPNQFLEICGPIKSADETKEKVAWQFSANDALEFNIHYHVAKDVIYPTKADAVRTMSADFIATINQEYRWMWQNKTNQSVSLSVVLKRVALIK
jgi:hypothetical protein